MTERIREAPRRWPWLRPAQALLAGTLALAFAGVVLAAPGFFSEHAMRAYAERYGEDALARLERWRGVIEEGRTAGAARKRESANDFFNRVPWILDPEHWGKVDYWATPYEMLGTNGGDCEDFSIAKYFSLAAMGVDEERLVITYVRATALDQAHMVLAYYEHPGSDPLILDNYIKEIRPASRRPDLIPVYSFNGDGLWMSVERGKGRRVGTAERLVNWRALLRRMTAELG